MKKGMISAKSEVMTPIWVCNLQNNLVDTAWFGRENVFNTAEGCEWKNSCKVVFSQDMDWRDYIRAKRLEIACGEAPYLSSRYDVLTRKKIDLHTRVGLLDRKLRVVNENVDDEGEWLKWSIMALKSVYGYEIRLDKVELARKNLELTFCENYKAKFKRELSVVNLEKIAQILRRNIICYDVLDGDVDIFRDLSFDAVVGNPPYHMVGGAGGSNDAPIYQKFVMQSMELTTRCVSMVIPARWFSGGRENLLRDFRKQMLGVGLKELVVYTRANEVFEWVRLSGGICCFLIEQGYKGECRYSLIDGDRRNSSWREFAEDEILIRSTSLERIVAKVGAKADSMGLGRVSEIISGNTPFGITSDVRDKNGKEIKLFVEKSSKHDIKLYFFDKPYRVMRYVDGKYISKNRGLVDKYKVILPAAGGSGSDKNVVGKPQLISPMSICSQTYLCATFEQEDEAKNFLKYVQTRFFRVLVSAAKVSQSAARRVYCFVPLVDFGRDSEIDWSGSVQEIEKQLYEMFLLDEIDMSYIEEEVAKWIEYE